MSQLLRATFAGGAAAIGRLTPVVVVLLVLTGSSMVSAKPAERWQVAGGLLGKNGKPSKDISGIACSPDHGYPRRCLVIDDNLQAAQRVTVQNGLLDGGEPVPLIDNTWNGKRLELDGEGVAFSDGVFYVIGSHGHPRDADRKLDPITDRDQIAARIKAASQIVPLRLGPDGSFTRLPVLTLTRAIAEHPDLRDAAGQRLDSNGVTIEGIAVVGDRVLAGFRGPTLLGGRAAVLSVTLSGLRDGNGTASRLFRLPLGEGQGVRDMAPLAQGFLILAGPTANEAGRYELFVWDGTSDDGVKSLGDITLATAASDKRKPEAVLPLKNDGALLQVLILSDGAKNGDPTVFAVHPP